MRIGGSNAAAQPNYADGGMQLKAGRLLASRKVPLLSSEQTLSIEISICLPNGPAGADNVGDNIRIIKGNVC